LTSNEKILLREGIMIKKISSILTPLSFCLLAPLISEQHSTRQDAQKEDQEKMISDAAHITYPTTKKTQQQGTHSSYDRHSSNQNHPSVLPQAAQQASAPSKGAIAQNEQQCSQRSQKLESPARMNTAVRPPLKDALNLWVNGEALLWQATEENLTYVYQTDLSGNTDLHTVDFQWDWGFRVSAGYNAPRDGWDLSLMWTHMENDASGSQKAHLDEVEVGSLPYLQAAWGINSFSPPPGILVRASAHWTTHLEQVDFALGREYYVGRYLTVHPHGGLRADWIYQSYKVNYTPSTFYNPQHFRMANKFFGFGFFGGLDSNWLLGKGFSLYGMADYAILLGFFDVGQKVTQLDPTLGPTKGTLDSSFRCGRSVLDLGLGLKWNRLFHHDTWGLTLKAGYEYHLFFDQNQFANITMTTTPFKYNRPEGDLTYQGVNISAQIDF
jgi:hypothetical protein